MMGLSNLAMDGRGEYVKFSKEKYLPDCPPDILRKELEEELNRSSDDMSSHAWYHGHMPREVSETLLLRDGDFLIRDSLTSMGDFVLTSRWESKILHFVIGKVQAESIDLRPHVQYLLGWESFESVAALVHFYVGSQKALSQESGARIYRPVNRTLPLRYLEAAFALAHGTKGLALSPSSPRGTYIRSSTDHIQEPWNPFSPDEQSALSPAYNSMTHHRSSAHARALGVVLPSPALRCKTGLDSNREPSPSSGFTLKTCKPHLFPTLLLPRAGGQQDGGGALTVPLVLESESSFRPGQYVSQLMPAENRPLEVCILKRVKELLMEVDARTAAQHLTKADCVVARILNISDDMQQTMAVNSGLELITLPQGHRLRLDLLERFHTMSITMAAELLGCTGSKDERAALLLKTILLAAELKTSQGNMFGFAAVMRALELPQISRLEQTWRTLRQKHTEGAILYEKKLKPFLKTMNEGKEGCTLADTSFPHVVPLLFLLEGGMATSKEVEPWESVDMGVDVVMSHLEAARIMAHHGEVICRNAEMKLQGFQEQPNVLEVFLTDFQIRLLWGSRGSEASQTERYQKFDKVLTALSNRLEPPGGHGMERT